MRCAYLAPLILSMLAGPLTAREFKSADGAKTFEADFVRFNNITGKVTLRVGGTRNVLMPATAFSEEDQAFFKEAQKEVDMKESVSVKIDAKSHTEREKDSKGKKKATKSTSYKFAVKNESYSTMEGMKLKFWVVVEHEKDGEKTMEVIKDEAGLGTIEPGAVAEVNGPTVTLQDEPGKKGGKGKTKDSVYGVRVEVENPAGEVVFSESSSNRVDKYLNR